MRHTLFTSFIAASTLSLAGCGDSDSKPAVPSADSTPSADSIPVAPPAPAAPAAPAEDSGSSPAPKPADDSAPAASADVTPAQKSTMESYVGTFEQLVDKAKGVTSDMTAMTSSPKIKELVDQLNGYTKQFEEYSPETMSALRKMYDDNLSLAKGRLDTELARLRENDSFKPIADLLGKIKMP